MRKKYMMVIMSLFIGWHCLAQGERGNICSLMDAPDTTGIWLQPAQTVNAYPKWGHVNGIQIGLWPTSGPRGLIRVYTPYLNQPTDYVMNFLAIEPIVFGTEVRGLSELEKSIVDQKKGKIFWSSNDTCSLNTEVKCPAPGIIETIDGEQTLTLYVFVEPFENGVKVYVRLRFFERRPYELEVSTFTYGNSICPKYCVITSTMGNKARLRKLYLKTGIETSYEYWPCYRDMNFAPHKHIPVSQVLSSSRNEVYFIAAPNEQEPSSVDLLPRTNPHWKYHGLKATQYWKYATPNVLTEGIVNGRYVYWASNSPIPGGISFENFELKTPYRQGDSFVFGITPLSPEEFIREEDIR